MISKPNYIIFRPQVGETVVTQELFLGLAHAIGDPQTAETELNLRIEGIDYIFDKVTVNTFNLEVVYRMLLEPAPEKHTLIINLADPYLKG